MVNLWKSISDAFEYLKFILFLRRYFRLRKLRTFYTTNLPKKRKIYRNPKDTLKKSIVQEKLTPAYILFQPSYTTVPIFYIFTL